MSIVRKFAAKWVLILTGALAPAGIVAAADDPPDTPHVEFFFSNADPRAAETRKFVEGVMKSVAPNIPAEYLSIDEKKHAKRLKNLEKEFDIKNPGEITLFFGPHFLIDKGEKRDIEAFFSGMMTRLIKVSKKDESHKDRIVTDVPKFAKEIFGEDATAAADNAQTGALINFYRVTKNGKPAGWIADAYDPIGCPICSGTQFLAALDDKLAIMEVRPVREIERIGTPLPDAETKKFIEQFKGKTPKANLEQIDGISRATKSVHAYQSLLEDIFTELKQRNK
ncbi:MAG TPA: FMN-binding protein [Planctomycetota bacterium]|nr:FMN-binding protein [Planctomycetota bacterium]